MTVEPIKRGILARRAGVVVGKLTEGPNGPHAG